MNISRRAIGLLAALGVLAILIGLPFLLVAIGANPIPDSVPSLEEVKTSLLARDDGTLAMSGIVVVAWAGWAFMAVSILVEAIALVCGVRAPRMPGLALPQSAARHLVAAAAMLVVATPMTGQTAHAETTPLAYAAAASTGHHHPASAPAATDEKTLTPTIAHTVQPGESLWSIAEEHLGDGRRYGEIVDLNRPVIGDKPGFLSPGWVLQVPELDQPATAGPDRYIVERGDTLSGIADDQLGDADLYMEIYDASTKLTQPGGARLSNPNVIDVGWTLNIPDRSGIAPPEPPRPDRQPTTPPKTHHEPPATPSSPPADQPSAEAPQPGQPGTDLDKASAQYSDDPILGAPWLLAGLTGGGVLLSGALLLGLRARRRTQFRARRPGRTIAAPDPGLAPVEMTITATGVPAAATVEFTHTALNRLAAAVGATGDPMPPLAAVELGRGALTLHLSRPADLPSPWQGTPDRLHWQCSTDIEADKLGPETSHVEPPYPLLVTIGASDTGETWLLNCEELAILTISGDATYGRDFVRHLAAQLAINPWSNRVRLDCVGVAEEAVVMDQSRISHHQPGQAAAEATSDLLADAVAMVDRSAGHQVDVSTGRTGQVDDDTWPARMLLLNAEAGDPTEFGDLLRLVNDHVGKSATSIVIAGDRSDTPGVVLRMTDTGRVILDHVGLDLIAVGLTSDETRGCALLYAQSEDLTDVEVPVDQAATDGWEAYADQAGGLRREHTIPRATPDEDLAEPASTLLEGDDEDYVREAPVVAEDLEVLAPKVPARVRDEVEAADPTLDADLADWLALTCDRPRLSLLGPVAARAHGKALAKRKPYFTELLTFLALRRRRGVTVDQVCDAFGLEPAKAREYVRIVRDWLGTNPRTGELHLPHADKAPAAKLRGVNVYQVDQDLLIDMELFKRLQLRGRARGGKEGLGDLTSALQLVTGRPFDQHRPGGWAWLFDGERHDEYMTVAIADTALIVTTHCLETGDLPRARAATEVAVLAAPHEEATRLCLAGILKAEGNRDEAARIVRDEICNRSDDADAPPEPSERTQAIIRTHQWLAT
jgi:LysM repeat protein